MVSKLFRICVKKWPDCNLASFFPFLFFCPPFFFDLSLFYSRPLCFVSRLPFLPPFSGSDSPLWGSNCHIAGKRGSRASFNGYGKSATAAILWDRAPAFLGMSIGSAYIPGRYVSLVVPGRLMYVPCSALPLGWSDPCRGGTSNMADLVLLCTQQFCCAKQQIICSQVIMALFLSLNIRPTKVPLLNYISINFQ